MGHLVDWFSFAPTDTYIKIHRCFKVGGFIFPFYPKNVNPHFKKSLNLHVCVCRSKRKPVDKTSHFSGYFFYKILTSRHFDFNETLEHFLFTTDISVYPKAYTHIASAIELFKIEKNSTGVYVLKDFPKQIEYILYLHYL